MGTVGRGVKSNGTTALADGNTIFAAELNTDYDTLYTLVNGQLDNDNVSASAAIAATKLNDYSATATEMRTQTSPGTSDNESLPTTMAGELERLRYALWQLKIGTTAARNDGAAKGLYWGDEPVRGANLCRNSSFEIKSSALATAAPDGWTLVGTPASCVLTDTTPGTGVSDGKLVRIEADASNEGISQTFAGLKPSTLYYVAARARVVAGGDILTISTTGAMASGEFRNISRTVTSTSVAQVSGVVQTDATPTAVVLQFILSASGDICEIDDVQFREINADIVSRMGYVAVMDSSTDTTGSVSNTFGAFPPSDQLSAAVTVPGPGYTIKATLTANTTDSGGGHSIVAAIAENGSRVSIGTAGYHASATGSASSTAIWVNTNPTPGTTYTYTAEAVSPDAPGPNGALAGVVGVTLESRLIVEMFPPG